MQITKQKTTDKGVATIDLMQSCDSWDIKIGNHGLVSLLDVMPRIVPEGRTADMAIVQAARTSTGGSVKSVEEDSRLIRYLYRHRHTSPFESVKFRFRHVLPIFVARQLIRHRTANVSEFSARYAEVPDRFWFPSYAEIRSQSSINKQHTEGSVDLATAGLFLEDMKQQSAAAMKAYQDALRGGIGREQARTILTVNLMTEWIWTIDCHNLLHFLGLRQDKHAQAEIRVYADAMYELVYPLIPATIDAYNDYHPARGGLLLSAVEIDLIGAGFRNLRTKLGNGEVTKSEVDELLGKLKQLGDGSHAKLHEEMLRGIAEAAKLDV